MAGGGVLWEGGPLPGLPSPVQFTEERQACVSVGRASTRPSRLLALPGLQGKLRLHGSCERAWGVCVCVWDLCLAQEAENSRHLPKPVIVSCLGTRVGEMIKNNWVSTRR